MGRRKSAAELQRQLQYAQRREAYTPPVRAEGVAAQKRQKDAVQYHATSKALLVLTLQASKEGVLFFGGNAPLGLADAGDDPTAPRGFHPNRILASVADATPTTVTSRSSGRTYIRYAKGTRGSNVQTSFSAPISETAAPTTPSVRAKFKTVADAIKGKLGGSYGRVWFEPERLLEVESG